MKYAIISATLIATAAVAWAQAPSIAVPDPKLTPGAIASTSVSEVCSRGYSRAHRETSDALKNQIAHEYGLRSRRNVEIDHLVPLCAGGADSAPNLWPQPWAQARVKDEIEWHVCAAVCEGHVPLALAQSWFLGDWRQLIGKKLP